MTSSMEQSILSTSFMYQGLSKRKKFNPHYKTTKRLNKLSQNSEFIAQLFPPYGRSWVEVELDFEKFFKERVDNWNKRLNTGEVITKIDLNLEFTLQKKYLVTMLKRLEFVDYNMRNLLKKVIKDNVDKYVSLEEYEKD